MLDSIFCYLWGLIQSKCYYWFWVITDFNNNKKCVGARKETKDYLAHKLKYLSILDAENQRCFLFSFYDVHFFGKIMYSKASRYTASSCTDLAGARFWIGSKRIRDEQIYVVKTLSSTVFWSFCLYPMK